MKLVLPTSQLVRWNLYHTDVPVQVLLQHSGLKCRPTKTGHCSSNTASRTAPDAISMPGYYQQGTGIVSQGLHVVYLTSELPLSDAPGFPMAHLALPSCDLSLCAACLLCSYLRWPHNWKREKPELEILLQKGDNGGEAYEHLPVTSLLPARWMRPGHSHIPDGFLIFLASEGRNGEEKRLSWERHVKNNGMSYCSC